ncbi:MAG: formate dehydrogenase accessory protein FdhE [Blastocatellia bacterium]
MIKRARVLGDRYRESTELLHFYARLLSSQKEIYDHINSKKGWLPSGNLEKDLPVLRPRMRKFLSSVESYGTEQLRQNAKELRKAGDDEIDGMLADQWSQPVDVQFFAKAFLQPYTRLLGDLKINPSGRSLGPGENRCRFCDGKPQVAYLRSEEGEGGGRYLVCSACLSPWLFRRMVCPNCGEEDPAKLGYYNAPNYEHIRVDTCEACRCYIKCVDRTRAGIAVPLVDEVAAAPLDVWAREKGYSKIELNLVGL